MATGYTIVQIAKDKMQLNPGDGLWTRYILCHQDGSYSYGKTILSVKAFESLTSSSLNRMERKSLNPEVLFPRCEHSWTRYTGALDDPEIFIKRQNFLRDMLFLKHPNYFPRLTTREVEVAEVLAKKPHPNVAVYRGVVTDDENRVVGIAYKRYDVCLGVHCHRNGKEVDISHVISSVEKAIKHFHHLGLVHNDVRLPNVFIKDGGKEVALGDFDAVHQIGERIDYKTGDARCSFTWGDKVTPEADFESLAWLQHDLTVLQKWYRAQKRMKKKTCWSMKFDLDRALRVFVVVASLIVCAGLIVLHIQI
ncbi:hypothetical protein BDV96DRAFT_648201 [Lophiotrema nucula]|uniref:Protein kinase domain-containing protein n=1 Tax=Lophiotrema nucula TaxID=690887 RepID=A0A6A5Z195_9PLEO|nr:hypothetical protein BDV96DRAFT_648201 [Lophiotrema nucula]